MKPLPLDSKQMPNRKKITRVSDKEKNEVAQKEGCLNPLRQPVFVFFYVTDW